MVLGVVVSADSLDGFNCSALLPPHTAIRSDGCCVVDPAAAAAAAAPEVVLCSQAASPYGNCVRQLNYPKPTPPR